jgi:hypothetical protein
VNVSFKEMLIYSRFRMAHAIDCVSKVKIAFFALRSLTNLCSTDKIQYHRKDFSLQLAIYV